MNSRRKISKLVQNMSLPPVYKRPSQHELELAFSVTEENGLISPTTSETTCLAQERTVMILRPLKSKHCTRQVKGKECIAAQGNRIVNIQKFTEWFNAAVKEHAKINCCGELYIPAYEEIRMGLGVSEVLCCDKCNFKSPRGKLYNEIQHGGRGRKAVALNMALQCGLNNTKIGNRGARVILTCLDTVVPSESAMQSTANKCNEILIQENIRDMNQKRTIVKNTLELQGIDRETPILVEADRSYNNPLRTARRNTPQQPATQMRDTVVENITTRKFVVMNNFENKLCKVGQRRKRQGMEPLCPNHEKCTATVKTGFIAGDEKDGGIKCAEKLLTSSEPIRVQTVTTDSDGKFAEGMDLVMRQKGETETDNLLDPYHLTRNTVKAISRETFSPIAFPGRNTEQRRKIHNRFADDIGTRAQAEIQAAFKNHCGDYRKVQSEVEDIIDAIVDCYTDKHTLCAKYSYVCSNKPKKRLWQFPYLPHDCAKALNFDENDKEKLKNILRNKRLGRRLIYKTRFQTSTQKTESVNHAYGRTNPKDVTWSRNAAGRISSAIHLVNNFTGDSILKKCEAANCAIMPNSPARKTAQKLQKRDEYYYLRSKSKKFKISRKVNRDNRYQSYYSEHYSPKSDYIRGQLTNEIEQGQTQKTKRRDEHSYSKLP